MRSPPEEQGDSSGLESGKVENKEEVLGNPNKQKVAHETEVPPDDLEASGGTEEDLSEEEDELSGYNK